MHDIIGDIHGHADELTELLHRLGYSEQSGVFRHPSRQVIFCGDFIDRGPSIKDVLRICRSMCENGAAQAVMGNHELNALAYHTPHPDRPGEFLRVHSDKNRKQHRETLEQLDAAELESALTWFRTLPICIDAEELRVVHACWDNRDFQILFPASDRYGYMTTEYLLHAITPGDLVFQSIERVMKGPEMHLPNNCRIVDKDGHKRSACRFRWYESPDGHNCATYGLPASTDPALVAFPVPPSACPALYRSTDPPVFIGHYWLTDHVPAPLAVNVACVDYSVARHGMLAAYRHYGKRQVFAENFVTVPGQK